MKLREQAGLIAGIPLFANLPPRELERLAEKLQPCEFAEGALLFQEGECDQRFFILLKGETEVVKAAGTVDERLLAVMSPGASFGEMSLFSPQGRHTASVRARTAVQALEMTCQDFDALLRRRPALAYEMMRNISRRLEESENVTIRDLRDKNRQLTQAYRELKEAQAQLVEKEKLEKELAIAHQIQASILPERLPRLPGFDVAALTFPARAVGGDYFDFIPLDGDRFGVVVGDACDKGIPAALFVTLTSSLVHVEAPRNPSPEATLSQVNHHLMEMNRSVMFITLLYGVLDATGRFDYCRAGHTHPLVLDEKGRPVPVGSRPGMPLGLMEGCPLDAHSLTIPPGGLAVLYSDGLTEARGPGDDEFGEKRLEASLLFLSHLPAEGVCAGLWKLVQEFSAGEPQSDDFTIVVIKRA